MVQTGSVPCVVLAQMLEWLHGKLYWGPNLSGENQKDGFSTWISQWEMGGDVEEGGCRISKRI